MVTELDDYVGELLAKLSELGIEKNTIVIFAQIMVLILKLVQILIILTVMEI